MNNKERKLKIQNMINMASIPELELVWIPKIMINQEIEEVIDSQTKYRNKTGLTPYDARSITWYYSYIKNGNHLNEGMAFSIRNKLKKYWRQYLEQMNNT